MPERPFLAYRVGITGTRMFPSNSGFAAEFTEPELREALARLFDAIEDAVGEAATHADAKHAYRHLAGEPIRPRMRLVSPLAEGADRLAAGVALDRGWELECPLPFAVDEYEKDFPASVADFCKYLAEAKERVFILDGAASDDADSSFARGHAYRSVGRAVVRHCDLLVALWNGRPGKGPGGTAEVVAFAAEFGPKVWWIDLCRQKTAADPALAVPRQLLIDNLAELRWATRPAIHPPNAPPEGAAAFTALARHVSETIRPPPPPRHHAHGLIAPMLEKFEHHRGRHHAHPLNTFLEAEHPKPRRLALFFRGFFLHVVSGEPGRRGDGKWAQCWGKLRDLVVRTGTGLCGMLCPHPSPTPSAATSVGPVQEYWDQVKSSTDSRANAFADRHRSTYVGVFTLAALSVAFGALAEQGGASVLLGLAELACLGLIFGLVAAHHLGHWQERWIGCRVLAEYCRIQRNLAPLGWGIVGGQLAVPVAAEETDPPRDAWMGWYFHAVLRDAPMHAGTVSEEMKRAMLKQVSDLASGQLTYNLKRQLSHERASNRLASAGEGFFLATVAAVILKVIIIGVEHALDTSWEWAFWLSAICTILPAISAALVGIRAFAEFDMLTWQSRRMRHAIAQSLARMELIQPERPLASEDIGLEMSRLAAIMLEDTAGWAQLFGGKAVEAG